MTRDEWKAIQPVLAAVIEGKSTPEKAIDCIREQHPQLEEMLHGLLHAWSETGSFMEEMPERLRLSILHKGGLPEEP